MTKIQVFLILMVMINKMHIFISVKRFLFVGFLVQFMCNIRFYIHTSCVLSWRLFSCSIDLVSQSHRSRGQTWHFNVFNLIDLDGFCSKAIFSCLQIPILQFQYTLWPSLKDLIHYLCRVYVRCLVTFLTDNKLLTWEY